MNPQTPQGPAAIQIESTSRQVLAHMPMDPSIRLHSVIALDGSDVRYQVVGVHREGEQCRVTVDVLDDPEMCVPKDRSPSSPGPAVHRVPSSDGVELTLHHLGGTGPALLISHATGFHGLAYAPLARALGDNFDVWAIDLRGHGGSLPPASGDFAWRGMADDVTAAVARMGAAPIVGVGHSMGGAAILLAELARPGLFEAAYLYEPIVLPPGFHVGGRENPMIEPARRRRPTFPSKKAALERYASRPPLNQLRLDSLAAYVEHGFVRTGEGAVRLACEPEHEAGTFGADDKVTFDDIHGLDLRLMVAAGAPEPGGGP
ncbi:MAG: alpha/beta hydrolase, partial [Actinomycetia bacterium]|nr:alpha/beta hydrolase [Actinomycetes bacterium]